MKVALLAGGLGTRLAEETDNVPKPMVEWCEVNLKNLTSINLGKGSHYLQEDHPHAIGEGLAEWYAAL